MGVGVTLAFGGGGTQGTGRNQTVYAWEDDRCWPTPDPGVVPTQWGAASNHCVYVKRDDAPYGTSVNINVKSKLGVNMNRENFVALFWAIADLTCSTEEQMESDPFALMPLPKAIPEWYEDQDH